MKKKIAIVGGGACALILACELDPQKFEVSVYEKNSALGRKFLVAGEGGLNLTYSENEANFISRYTPSFFLENAFSYFSNKGLVNWINELGVETYVGSSGRVFPKEGIKPIEVLNKILEKIKKNKTSLYTKIRLTDFSLKDGLVFESQVERKEVKSDVIIFCMGGASWPVTGSAGDWASLFKKNKIRVTPFQASNCSFNVDWGADKQSKIEGKVLKNISVSCGDKKLLGEIVMTHAGIEGSGIYPFSPEIRVQLQKNNKAEIAIDFKPDLSLEKIIEKIGMKPAGKNLTEHLKTHLHLGEGQIMLLKYFVSKEEFLNSNVLAQRIKEFKLTITGTGPIEDAISTVGGVALEEVDETFQLNNFPGHFVIGEMLDYDAPTGGYLLQSCFSMAKYLAHYLNAKNF